MCFLNELVFLPHRFSSAEILEAHEELDEALRVTERAVVRGAVAVLIGRRGEASGIGDRFRDLFL